MERIETGRLALIPDAQSAQFEICKRRNNGSVGRMIVGSDGSIFVRVDEDFRRKGYGTEAARAAVWHAFEKLDRDVVSARIESANLPAQRTLETLGFVEHAGEWRLYHTDHLPGPDWDSHDIARPEGMGAFFDARADGYDAHMFSFGGGASYAKLGACVPETGDAVRILDIGCGTGIELDYIWQRAPHAHVTCVDLSRGMLDLLIENHRERTGQIAVVEASYVDWAYPKESFDLVISSNTMHHFWESEKVAIYRRVLSTLAAGGAYIESDFIVDAWCEKQYRKRYEIFVERLGRTPEAGEFHIDIPFTIERQTLLLQEAGFQAVEVLDDSVKPRWSGAILKAIR